MTLAVMMATTMNSNTATIEGRDKEDKPHMPWPDVQPFDKRAPKPTNTPPIAKRKGVICVLAADSGPNNHHHVAAPATKPKAHTKRHTRESIKAAC